MDFLDFVDKLASRVRDGPQFLRSNHVTWLLAQILRIEIVMNTLSSDPRKVFILHYII
jgi:mediator of RNA polymerase II transcription subunit 23